MCSCQIGYNGTAELIGSQLFLGCEVLDLCDFYGCNDTNFPGNCSPGPPWMRLCSCTGSFSANSRLLSYNETFGGCCVPTKNVVCTDVDTIGLTVNTSTIIFGNAQISDLVLIDQSNLTVIGNLSLYGHTTFSSSSTLHVQGCASLNGTLNITIDTNTKAETKYNLFKYACVHSDWSDINIVGNNCLQGAITMNSSEMSIFFLQTPACETSFPLYLVLGCTLGGLLFLIILFLIVFKNSLPLRKKLFPYNRHLYQKKYPQDEDFPMPKKFTE